MPVHSKLLSAVALVALVVSGNAKDTNLRSNQADPTPTTTPVTYFSVNIGSTELERCTLGDYKADRYNCKSRCNQFRIDQLSCKKVNSKTITVTPVFDQKIELPYGTTITCPEVVNKNNWLSGETHGETFGITVAGNKITAQRTDKSGSWGIDLKFKCKASPTTAAEDAAKSMEDMITEEQGGLVKLTNEQRAYFELHPEFLQQFQNEQHNKKDAALAEAANKKDAALAECQKMPDLLLNVKKKKLSYGIMKKKKNCFKNLAGPRKSAAFQACRKIKPNGKSYVKMKNKKDCFRDLAFSDIILQRVPERRRLSRP